jgi:2-keto-4-pentenoate hydratase/2-oxohepta-3-ene-1,7-dioic acid hydratase in catechol pathway
MDIMSSHIRRRVRLLWHGRLTTAFVEGGRIVALDDYTPVALGTLDSVRLLPPCQPQTIVAIGRNYAEHAAEQHAEVPQEPLIFLKPITSVIAAGEAIVYPSWVSQHVEYEGELAVVIGSPCYRVSEADALQYVRGYTIANDVTARDLQRRDGQWTRGKGFETFCPLGPVVAEGIDPSDLHLMTRVNGELKQDDRTSSLIFSIPRLISHVTAVMTLMPGDVILTGTPSGVGPIVPGDVVEVEIEGIGTLRNPVVAGDV